MAIRATAISLCVVALFATSVQAGALCTTAGLAFSDADVSRLNHLPESRQRGLAGSLRAQSQGDRAILADLLENAPSPIVVSELVGTYQCRTIKLGGALSLIVYNWFKCEIGVEDGVHTLRKITGSQNFFGTLTPSGTALTYRGAQHYGYEDSVRFYGTDHDRDQVGCMSAVGNSVGHMILELPSPRVESDHDIIEFIKAR